MVVELPVMEPTTQYHGTEGNWRQSHGCRLPTSRPWYVHRFRDGSGSTLTVQASRAHGIPGSHESRYREKSLERIVSWRFLRLNVIVIQSWKAGRWQIQSGSEGRGTDPNELSVRFKLASQDLQWKPITKGIALVHLFVIGLNCKVENNQIAFRAVPSLSNKQQITGVSSENSIARSNRDW